MIQKKNDTQKKRHPQVRFKGEKKYQVVEKEGSLAGQSHTNILLPML